MIYERPICFDCKHYNIETGTCKAFPVEIPDEIYIDGNKHNKPLPDQPNDIVFEKKEDGNTE